MSLLNLQEIDHHLYHHHHHHHQNRTDEHDPMESGGSTSIRSYDCVFCQRGFTTAQALGGHMNIHRKDRANPSTIKHNNSPAKEPTIITNKEILFEEDYDDDQFSVANTRLLYSNNSSYLSSQNQGYDGGSSSFEGQVHRFMGSEKWADPNPNSRVVSSHNNNINNNNNNNMIGKRVQDDGHSMEGEEIDLELRLGHYSW